jgi:YD repeat-containing protein
MPKNNRFSPRIAKVGLTTVTDGDGNVTTIERDADGNPTAIVSPYGQRTSFELDDNGYLKKITNPANEEYQYSYSADGLLSQFTDPRGNIHKYSYDDLGRLIKDEDPAGGYTALEHTTTEKGYKVTKATTEGNTRTYLTEKLSTGGQQMTNSLCCGNPIKTIVGTDGSAKITYPDGTVAYTLKGPDPRFSMQLPIINYGTITTPSGVVQTMTWTRTVTLSDKDDPLSLLTQTDKVTVNGKTTTTSFDASTKKTTTTSPAGRVATTTMDDQGRLTKTEIPEIATVSIDYDTQGRLTTLTVGTDTDARVTRFSYNSEGYLDTVTNPLSQNAIAKFIIFAI